MARESVLHEMQEVAVKFIEESSDLTDIGTGYQFLHESRARLTAGKFQLLAIGFSVDTVDE